MFWFLACLVSPSEYADLEAQAQDADGDGQGAVAYGGLDCDDSAPETYAGAPEQCDGLDNDCDQDVDEDIEGLPLFYPDQDNDGYGSADGARSACEQPEGFVTEGGDCDDGNPAVRPGQTEVCGNGLDDDCVQGGDGCWRAGGLDLEELEFSASVDDYLALTFWPQAGALIHTEQDTLVQRSLDSPGSISASGNGEFKVEVEHGIRADARIAVQSSDGTCVSSLLEFTVAESCSLPFELVDRVSVMLGSTLCAGGSRLTCALEPEMDPIVEREGETVLGAGPWSGAVAFLGIGVGGSVEIYSEAQLIQGATSPTATLTLPATPTDLCLLDQAVVWADSDGTHLTSAAGDTVLISGTTGQLQCMEAGSEYVMIIPPSNDTVEVVNLSGFGESAWGLPLVVSLPESDELLANKATLASSNGQTYLFIAHGTELRRLALGLGL